MFYFFSKSRVMNNWVYVTVHFYQNPQFSSPFLSNGLKPETGLSLSVNQDHNWFPRKSPETDQKTVRYTFKIKWGWWSKQKRLSKFICCKGQAELLVWGSLVTRYSSRAAAAPSLSSQEILTAERKCISNGHCLFIMEGGMQICVLSQHYKNIPGEKRWCKTF